MEIVENLTYFNQPIPSSFGLKVRSYKFDDHDVSIWRFFFRFDVEFETDQLDKNTKQELFEQYLDTEEYHFLKNRFFLVRRSKDDRSEFILKKWICEGEEVVIVEEESAESRILQLGNEICSKDCESISKLCGAHLFSLHITRIPLFEHACLEICDWSIGGKHCFYSVGEFSGNVDEIKIFQENHPTAHFVPESMYACMYSVFRDSFFYSMPLSFRLSSQNYFESNRFVISRKNLHAIHPTLTINFEE